MKFFLLLAFVAYGSAAVIDECAKGQEHWCTSLKVAKRCDAVRHCIDNVWSEQAPYKADKTDVCTFCKNVIGDVRNVFNNKSEAQITRYLEAACGLCPEKTKCLSYVDNDVSEVFECIRSRLEPGAVCSAMELCAAYKDFTVEPQGIHRVAIIKAHQDVEVHAAHMTSTTAAPNVCADCEKLFTDLKLLVTEKKTEDQLEAYLIENACDQIPVQEVQDECTQLVKTYVPELIELSVNQLDPKLICGALGFCEGGDRSLLPRMRLSKSPLFVAASKRLGTSECDACKVVLTQLQDLTRNNVVQQDVEKVLKTKLCPALGSLTKECLATVNAYGHFLFEFLVNELDPNTRCESLGFCSQSNSIKDYPTRQATPVHKPAVTQPPQCVICEFVIDKLDDMLEDNSTEAEIVSALDEVCRVLPDTIKEECDSFITEYGAAILDLLLQELSPQIVCSTLGLCIPAKGLPPKPSHPVYIRKNAVFKTSETCGVCEVVMTYMDDLLEEKTTVDELEAALAKVCDEMPIKVQCRKFVDEYTPQIIQIITQLVDPKKVCTELGLCMKKRVKQMVIERPVKMQMVGVNKCTYGPAYWCSSRTAAKECTAEAHCEKHGWAKP